MAVDVAVGHRGSLICPDRVRGQAQPGLITSHQHHPRAHSVQQGPGLIAWNFAVPQLRRLILDSDDERAALTRRRTATVEAVRTLARHRQEALAHDS